MNKLNLKTCGLVFGILYCVGFIFLSLATLYGPWEHPVINYFSSLHASYSDVPGVESPGGVWVFLDEIIFGCIVTWLYYEVRKT